MRKLATGHLNVSHFSSLFYQFYSTMDNTPSHTSSPAESHDENEAPCTPEMTTMEFVHCEPTCTECDAGRRRRCKKFTPMPGIPEDQEGEDEEERNEIVAAINEIIRAQIDECTDAEVSGEQIFNWVSMVGEATTYDAIVDGANVITDQVVEILEQEASGATSTADDIVETISEVVAEHILNPEILESQLDETYQIRTEVLDVPEDFDIRRIEPHLASTVLNVTEETSSVELDGNGQVVPESVVGEIVTTRLETIQEEDEDEEDEELDPNNCSLLEYESEPEDPLDEDIRQIEMELKKSKKPKRLRRRKERAMKVTVPGEFADNDDDQLRMRFKGLGIACDRAGWNENIDDEQSPILAGFAWRDDECGGGLMDPIPNEWRVQQIFNGYMLAKFEGGRACITQEDLPDIDNYYEAQIPDIIKHILPRIRRRMEANTPYEEFKRTVLEHLLYALDDARREQDKAFRQLNDMPAFQGPENYTEDDVQGCRNWSAEDVYGPENYTEADIFGPRNWCEADCEGPRNWLPEDCEGPETEERTVWIPEAQIPWGFLPDPVVEAQPQPAPRRARIRVPSAEEIAAEAAGACNQPAGPRVPGARIDTGLGPRRNNKAAPAKPKNIRPGGGNAGPPRAVSKLDTGRGGQRKVAAGAPRNVPVNRPQVRKAVSKIDTGRGRRNNAPRNLLDGPMLLPGSMNVNPPPKRVPSRIDTGLNRGGPSRAAPANRNVVGPSRPGGMIIKKAVSRIDTGMNRGGPSRAVGGPNRVVGAAPGRGGPVGGIAKRAVSKIDTGRGRRNAPRNPLDGPMLLPGNMNVNAPPKRVPSRIDTGLNRGGPSRAVAGPSRNVCPQPGPSRAAPAGRGAPRAGSRVDTGLGVKAGKLTLDRITEREMLKRMLKLEEAKLRAQQIRAQEARLQAIRDNRIGSRIDTGIRRKPAPAKVVKKKKVGAMDAAAIAEREVQKKLAGMSQLTKSLAAHRERASMIERYARKVGETANAIHLMEDDRMFNNWLQERKIEKNRRQGKPLPPPMRKKGTVCIPRKPMPNVRAIPVPGEDRRRLPPVVEEESPIAGPSNMPTPRRNPPTKQQQPSRLRQPSNIRQPSNNRFQPPADVAGMFGAMGMLGANANRLMQGMQNQKGPWGCR